MATEKATKQVEKEQATKSTGTNGMAIAGFVCSFFVSILGIIFGIVGLSQIKKSNEGGKGLAIAGIVIGSVFTAISIVALVFIVIFSVMATDKAIDAIDRGIVCGYEYEYVGDTYKSVWRCD